MPHVDHARREIRLKIVYYGPGLGGKTTNLEWIHANTRSERRGKLISLKNESERTLFFDLLPLDLGTYRGYAVRLQLCTVPGQIALNATRQLVLKGVDGVVFVVDSQLSRLEENIESLTNLSANLRQQGDDPHRLPCVVQYNKRDLPTALELEELRGLLGVSPHAVETQAVASQGAGVFETLKLISKEALQLVASPEELRPGYTRSSLPPLRPSMFPVAPAWSLPNWSRISSIPPAPSASHPLLEESSVSLRAPRVPEFGPARHSSLELDLRVLDEEAKTTVKRRV